jgi:hypothetical protein
MADAVLFDGEPLRRLTVAVVVQPVKNARHADNAACVPCVPYLPCLLASAYCHEIDARRMRIW